MFTLVIADPLLLELVVTEALPLVWLLQPDLRPARGQSLSFPQYWRRMSSHDRLPTPSIESPDMVRVIQIERLPVGVGHGSSSAVLHVLDFELCWIELITASRRCTVHLGILSRKISLILYLIGSQYLGIFLPRFEPDLPIQAQELQYGQSRRDSVAE
jgi:hypothetical protein